MKKCIIFSAFILSLALAAGCDKPRDTKAVAIVNISQVFQESEAAKAGMKYLEDIGDEMQKEFLALQQDLEKDPNNAEKEKKFNESLTAFQGRLNAEQQQVLTRINDTFQQVTDAYREKNNIAVILRSDQVVSMDAAYDVTNDIVKEMNKLELTFTPITPADAKDASAASEADSEKTKEQAAPDAARAQPESAANASSQASDAEKNASDGKAEQKEKASASDAKPAKAQTEKADAKKK